ncbi:MAG: hypothetical protein ABR571_17240, partial [Jatrophihabitans sp.]|uniref:DivIVA domain-containing protein n=1 Tax=Jatrophihabitans sp. TaxID=1932789 RepID=UPI00390DB205
MLHLVWYGLLAILLAAGLFALAARFLPAGEQIAPPLRDEPPWELPPDRSLDAEEIDTVRLPVALRGYRFAETDLLLDRLAAELRVRDDEIARLRGGVPALVEQPPAELEPVPAGASVETTPGYEPLPFDAPYGPPPVLPLPVDGAPVAVEGEPAARDDEPVQGADEPVQGADELVQGREPVPGETVPAENEPVEAHAVTAQDAAVGAGSPQWPADPDPLLNLAGGHQAVSPAPDTFDFANGILAGLFASDDEPDGDEPDGDEPAPVDSVLPETGESASADGEPEHREPLLHLPDDGAPAAAAPETFEFSAD